MRKIKWPLSHSQPFSKASRKTLANVVDGDAQLAQSHDGSVYGVITEVSCSTSDSRKIVTSVLEPELIADAEFIVECHQD